MNKPIFSIILPVYNVESYLMQCLESIEKQTFGDFEVLCVDDASTDNSLKLLEEFSQKDSRFKIIKHEVNQSLGASRNTALSYAQGKYLCCVDSDDWIKETMLEKIYNAFENNDVDSVWFNTLQYLEKEDVLKDFSIILNKNIIKELKEGILNITPDNINCYAPHSWNKAYKTSLLKENNLFWLPKVYYEDVFFYFNIYIIISSVYFIDENLYYYRRRQSSIIGDNKLKLIRDRNMYTVLLEVFKKNIKNPKFNEYKTSIIKYGDRYKKQMQLQFVSPFIQAIYNKFLIDIKNLEQNL